MTGASAGLGPHIARRLHREGANLVLSARNEAALKQLAGELGGARVVVADLSKQGEAERLAGHVVFMSSIAGKLPTPGLTIYNATKFAVLRLRALVARGAVGHGCGSVRHLSRVRQRGGNVGGATGLKPHPIVGEVTPAQVADAVATAISKNRREVDVAGLGMKASLVVQALAPGAFAAAGRRPEHRGSAGGEAARQAVRFSAP